MPHTASLPARISISVGPQTAARLRTVAEAGEESVAAVVRRAVRELLAREESRPNQPQSEVGDEAI
jgi:Arc/MetJ-type ribon-helix-helix transcriptional regulator